MTATRRPGPELARYVSLLWASDGAARPGARELVLPTGAMHLALRVRGPKLALYAHADAASATTVGHAVVGGARGAPYVRDIGEAVSSVGAQLLPGAAQALFGVGADALAGQHTPLEALWGASAVEALLDALAALPPGGPRIARLEAALTARIRARFALHPAVAEALVRLEAGAEVGAVVQASGFSHRHLSVLFQREVGLAPKLFADVRRFAAVVAQMRASGAVSLSALAVASGYCDQAHLTRAFRARAGLPPGRYRALAPASAHHVPLDAADGASQVKFVQDAARVRRPH